MFHINFAVLFLLFIELPPTVSPSQGELVDVKKLVPDVVLDLRYATENNFTHHRVYDRAVCLARRSTAEKLAAVQKELQTEGLGLKLFDCYRPLSVQKKFWSLVPDERYVANPARGSRHNRGAALDLTLIRVADGKQLDMGTEFDDFTERAHRDYASLPPNVRTNRKKLEDVMARHGFIGLPTEWWHFDDRDWERYAVT
jgi:D-alanyl-D-alanine dipeptidase